MKRAARALLCATLALAAAPALWATTILKQTDGDMIRQSGTIVTGRCTNLETAWVGRTLVTKATIAVDETLKGASRSELTVVLPGGVDMNRKFPIMVTYPGAPEIMVREQVLLFLSPDSLVKDGYSIVGYSQGKFTLTETAEAGLVGTQNLSGVQVQTQLQTGRQAARGGAASINLQQLREQIREMEVQ